jgi:hypothetical protein
MTPALVVEELIRHGYKKISQPLHVADLDFDFAGALTGPNDQDSLTLVVDGRGPALAAARRRLSAFAIVLDRTGSVRPITVVVVGDDVNSKALASLEKLARVVVVTSETSLADSLFTLLPLVLPEPIAADLSADAVLREELQGQSDSVTNRLLRAAKNSADRVKTTMRNLIKEAIEAKS